MRFIHSLPPLMTESLLRHSHPGPSICPCGSARWPEKLLGRGNGGCLRQEGDHGHVQDPPGKPAGDTRDKSVAEGLAPLPQHLPGTLSLAQGGRCHYCAHFIVETQQNERMYSRSEFRQQNRATVLGLMPHCLLPADPQTAISGSPHF